MLFPFAVNRRCARWSRWSGRVGSLVGYQRCESLTRGDSRACSKAREAHPELYETISTRLIRWWSRRGCAGRHKPKTLGELNENLPWPADAMPGVELGTGGNDPRLPAATVLSGQSFTGGGGGWFIIALVSAGTGGCRSNRIRYPVSRLSRRFRLQWAVSRKIGEDMPKKVSFDDEPLYSLMKELTTKVGYRSKSEPATRAHGTLHRAFSIFLFERTGPSVCCSSVAAGKPALAASTGPTAAVRIPDAVRQWTKRFSPPSNGKETGVEASLTFVY